jgi:uncharacterized RDD family membrane protein YckC
VARSPEASPPATGSPTAASYPDFGPGSVAGFGARIGAFLIDGLLADVLAVIVDGGFHNSGRHSLVSYLGFLLIEVVFVALAGQTPGMRVVGIAVVRADGRGRAALKWVLFRTLLLAVVAPALVIDGSGRAMHDRAAGTVMLHTR